MGVFKYNGLFTYTVTHIGMGPSSRVNPPDCTMATVVLCRKFTLHKNRPPSLNTYCTHFQDRDPSLDRSVYVNRVFTISKSDRNKMQFFKELSLFKFYRLELFKNTDPC